MGTRDLYWFNPTCETAIANGSETFVASRILLDFEADLAFLPMFIASSSDVVLSSYKPSVAFRNLWEQVGFVFPSFYSEKEILSQKNDTFSNLKPWGWSPAAHFQLKELKKSLPPDFQYSKMACWKPEHRLLFERKTAAGILSKFLVRFGGDSYCSPEIIPQLIYSEEEAIRFVEHTGPSVLKSPLSSSGRGIQMIRSGQLNQTSSQWIRTVLKQIGYLTAERLLNKKLDISFQFDISEDGKVEYLGFGLFFTSPNGIFQGHLLNGVLSDFSDEISEEMVNETGQKLRDILAESDFPICYAGKLGIDAMLVDQGDGIKIHPCLEINCRMTMGLLAMHVSRFIHPESRGKYEIFSDKEKSFSTFSEEMKSKFPIEIKDGRFLSGFVPLTESFAAGRFGAYLLLAPVE